MITEKHEFSWERKSDGPYPLMSHSFNLWNEYFYVFGGECSTPQSETVRNKEFNKR